MRKRVGFVSIVVFCCALVQSAAGSSSKEPKYTNRLINEKSPYLLQHAHNPVDWYPWGEEAFQRAIKEDKPIFLSIGYSTCHWCHVMEEESFADPDIAELINSAFVAIKVDREERPDIDAVYMEVAQLMTGGGGWPLTVIMTPDKKPFFAATYIPKEDRFGQTGLTTLIPRIRQAWKEKRTAIDSSAESVRSALVKAMQGSKGDAPDLTTLKSAFTSMARSYDPARGGFLPAPKFPTAHRYLFLLRHWKRTGNAKALEMVYTTLDAMKRGGIWDHVGYGFHRYSTDPEWLVPHFEKMIYDQALLAMLYTEAYQVSGKERYRGTVEEIFTYVFRDMTSKSGAFFSAEGADSEGEEGLFYLWTKAEIDQALGSDADLFAESYGVRASGNFEDPVGAETHARNILHLAKPIETIARDREMKVETLVSKIETARRTLFETREERIHPFKDDKILTDWNGLMIASLARASQAFGERDYAKAASRAAEFVLEKMRHDEGLHHRYRAGEAGIDGKLDDYAFLVWGLLELYEATWDLKWLEQAIELTDEAMARFEDKSRGGFFLTANDAEQLIARPRQSSDGAIPSGNSVMMLNLLRIGRITGRPVYEETADRITTAFGGTIREAPAYHTMMLCALDFALGPSYEIVVVGDPETKATRAMLDQIVRPFMPNKVVLLKTIGPDSRLEQLAPFTEHVLAIDGKPTAYVCTNYVCKLPTTDTAVVRRQLGMEP